MCGRFTRSVDNSTIEALPLLTDCYFFCSGSTFCLA